MTRYLHREACELQTALAKGRARRVERLGPEKRIAVLLALDSRLWTLVRFASAKTAHVWLQIAARIQNKYVVGM
jgi:hypothetical protein